MRSLYVKTTLSLYSLLCLSDAALEGKRLRATERKPQLLSNLRRLGAMSEIAEDTYAHLLELCMDDQGRPNSRNTCTNGYGHAAAYVASQLEAMGLTPLGDVNRTTFVQTVEGSVDETWCPPGIKNVIGMVPGSTFPDEYIVYAGHIDGPNNQNPQTELTRGNGDTCNAFDDGLAVAVGLAMAKQLMMSPPLRSVIFLFDDGEESWPNVGERQEGEYAACERFYDTEWFNQAYEVTGGNPECEGLDRCTCGYTIGSSYWVKNPTVNFADIKMMYFVDPLGSPFNASSNILTAFGGDQVSYNATSGSTLNDFLDEVWPSNTTVQLLKGPRAGVDGEFGSSMDTVTNRHYDKLCGDNCLEDGGVPAVWIFQPSFQKYHGGTTIDVVRYLFGLMLGNGTFPTPAYFSVDNLAAFDLVNLDALVTSLLELVQNTANSDSVTDLAYDSDKGNIMTRADMLDVMNMYDVLLTGSQTLPEPTNQIFSGAITELRREVEGIAMADLTDSAIQGAALSVAQGAAGLAISIDFFYPGYPEGEAFLDQTFDASERITEDEPAPPENASASSKRAGWSLFAWSLVVFLGRLNLF